MLTKEDQHHIEQAKRRMFTWPLLALVAFLIGMATSHGTYWEGWLHGGIVMGCLVNFLRNRKWLAIVNRSHVVITVLACALLASTTGIAEEGPAQIRYANEWLGIEFAVPEGYLLLDVKEVRDPREQGIVTPVARREPFNIFIMGIRKVKDPRPNAISWVEKEAFKVGLGTGKVASEQAVTISGEQGYEFDMKSDEKGRKQRVIWFRKKGFSWNITFDLKAVNEENSSNARATIVNSFIVAN